MTNTAGKKEFPDREPAKSRQVRILVADDDKDAAETLMMLLRLEGYDVRVVYRGTDVIRAVKNFDPDAAILDIKMPGLSGYEVAKRIRDRQGGEKLLLIGISGTYKSDSDRVLGLVVGFDRYLLKPYEPRDLLKLLAPLRNQIVDRG